MTDIAELEKILDPSLGQIEATAAHDARRLEIWRHCVLSFPFSAGDLQWIASSSPITEIPHNLDHWVTINLKGQLTNLRH